MNDMVDPWDEWEFLNLSLKHLNLTVPGLKRSDLKSDAVVEIYDRRGLQIFRNMTFIEKSGYSLLDMVSVESSALYQREKHIEESLRSVIEEVLSGGKPNWKKVIPTHLVTEASSSTKQIFEIRFLEILPVKESSGGVFGVFLMSHWKRVDIKFMPEPKENLILLGRIFESLGFGNPVKLNKE